MTLASGKENRWQAGYRFYFLQGKLIALFLLILWSGFPLSGKAGEPEPARLSVAIVEFDVMGDLGIPDAGSIIAEWMVSSIGRTEKFDLKERVLLKKVLAEQQLVLSGIVDEAMAARIGKVFGVQGVITGGVMRWGNTISVTARLIDTTSGTILKTADVKAGDVDAIPDRINDLARMIAGLTVPEKAEEISIRPGRVLSGNNSGAGDAAGLAVSHPGNATMRKTFREPVTGMEFVWVEGGCFQMGQSDEEKGLLIKEEGRESYEKNYNDELPRHKVCVDGVWVARFEVTNRQFRQFKPDHKSLDHAGIGLNGDEQPVVYVSWQEAKDFAAWLSARNEGQLTFRLPREAEWEYGCRAGVEAPRYWGKDADEACKFANVNDRISKKINQFAWTYHDCDDGFAATAPVGRFYPNAFGLYDMLGNVWEWVEDVYVGDGYRLHGKKNPAVIEGGDNRVRRGGCWNNEPGSIRCANRGKRSPDRQNSRVGFRLVMEKKEVQAAIGFEAGSTEGL